MPSLAGNLTEIYDFGSLVGSQARRVVAVNYFDKVIFAQPDSQPLYWNGTGDAKKLPGLPTDELYWGCQAYDGVLLLWRNNYLRWSGAADFSRWLIVNETISDYVLNLESDYTQLAVDTESDWVYFTELAPNLAVGQYLRVDYPADNYNFYEVTEVFPQPDFAAEASATQTITVGSTQPLFINAVVPHEEGTQIYFEGLALQKLRVVETPEIDTQALTVATDFTLPAVGGSVTVDVTVAPLLTTGGYVSVSSKQEYGQAVFEVTAIDRINNTVTLERTGVELSTPPATVTAGYILTPQPYILVENLSGSDATTPAPEPALLQASGVKWKLLDLEGVADPATVIPANQQVETLNASKAGDVVNAGTDTNGDIKHVAVLGEYAYIFKERSIQLMYPTGEFAYGFRPAVTGEGILGRYAHCQVGVDRLYFIGNRNIYVYGGGSTLQPIAPQHRDQFYEDLDYARLDEIFGFHHEDEEEVWFVYPQKGDAGTWRVLVYNYADNTVTLDDYTDKATDVTTAGKLEWDVDGTKSEHNLVGLAEWGDDQPQLVNYGEDFNRKGDGISSEWETIDLGDGTTYLYVDTVHLSLEVRNPSALAQIMPLQVWVGGRRDYDDATEWGDPLTIQAQGNGMYSTKVHVKRAGRFIRIRFRSTQADVQWRISSLRVMGRVGGGA